MLSSNGLLGSYNLVKQKLEDLTEEVLKPKPLLRGDDLIAAGYQPGPAFGSMLRAAEDAQLEGRVNSREEALELVRKEFGPP